MTAIRCHINCNPTGPCFIFYEEIVKLPDLIYNKKMKTYDFTRFQKEKFLLYGGSSPKFGILIDGEPWMIKFTDAVRTPEDRKLSSVRRCVSEYIGSHVYEILGVPVQQTILGSYKDWLVVGCKDLRGKDWAETKMVLFDALKNVYTPELYEFEERVDIFQRHGFPLEAVQAMFRLNPQMTGIPGFEQQFWDMFVIDAMIGNQKRKNEDWGELETGENRRPCPVFDNDAAFQNVTFDEQTKAMMSDETAMGQAACDVTSYFVDEQDQHIHPFDHITGMKDPKCNEAVLRIVPKIDMEKIEAMTEEIPAEIGGFPVISDIQREYCIKIMKIRYEKILKPVYDRLTESGR